MFFQLQSTHIGKPRLKRGVTIFFKSLQGSPLLVILTLSGLLFDYLFLFLCSWCVLLPQYPIHFCVQFINLWLLDMTI